MGVRVANGTVGAGMVAVCVNVGEAGINNVAVGVITAGVHAHRLNNRIVETSRLDLLVRLTLIFIPLTLPFDFTSQPMC